MVGIIANPIHQGYRLITRSGTTIARGIGLDGQAVTGTPISCT